MKRVTLLILFLMIFFPNVAYSHPHDMGIFNSDRFAKSEMKNKCSVCHVSPNGGGSRNDFGMAFEENNEKITNSIRKQFPELFNLLQALAPKIKRVKPQVFLVGQETNVVIVGTNFSEDSILHIDSVSLESLPHIGHELVSANKIKLTVTFDTLGKHTFHIVSPLGQVSNVYKVIAKNVKS